MARNHHVLIARASFHGRVVEEQFVRTGVPVEIGAPGATSLGIPVPEGHTYVARAQWTSLHSCEVTSADGTVHLLGPGRDLVLRLGDVTLELSLVQPERLARVGAVALASSLAWLGLVSMSCAGGVQVSWLYERSCDIAGAFLPGMADVGLPLLWVLAPFGGLVAGLFLLVMSDRPREAVRWLVLPLVAAVVPVAYQVSGYTWKSGEQFFVENMSQCIPPAGEDGRGGNVTAEYLARLLRRDYDGADQGVIEDRIERPKSEKETDEFMPAGSPGPITKMGGAENTSSKPVRSIVEDEPSVAAKAKAQEMTAPQVEGPKMQGAAAEDETKAGERDGIADLDPEDKRSDAEAPSEEHKGWGFPEWYDERDKAMDDMEIEMSMRIARHRLAINPDDPQALSILSYYQYLAQDYNGARKTYDHYIELFPDDPAGYNNKALIYKREGEYQKEESLYRIALALAPGDTTAMNNLGVNLAHQHRFEEALAVMRELEITDPRDAYADLHRAKIHAEMGKDEEALRYLEKSLEGMSRLDTLHEIEFRQDIRLDPSFEKLRDTYRFRAILDRFYGKDSPLEE